jgi:hypothetical protein
MSRRFVVMCFIAGLLSTGCMGGREVSVQPGECYCELSNPEVINFGNDLKFKMHYLFPDGPPKHEAWFTCTFEIMGTSTSSITIRKMGKELMDEGDFEGSTNVQFLRSLHGTFAVTVRQGPTKNGPFRDVSGRFVSDF